MNIKIHKKSQKMDMKYTKKSQKLNKLKVFLRIAIVERG